MRRGADARGGGPRHLARGRRLERRYLRGILDGRRPVRYRHPRMADLLRLHRGAFPVRHRRVRVRQAHLDPAAVRTLRRKRADPEGPVQPQVHQLRRIPPVAIVGAVLHVRGWERQQGKRTEGADECLLRRRRRAERFRRAGGTRANEGSRRGRREGRGQAVHARVDRFRR